MHLSIYLAKKGQSVQDLVIQGPTVATFNVAADPANPGVLFVQTRDPSPPAWSELFQGYLDVADIGLVSSTAAVYVQEVDHRLFAMSFGLGRYLLREPAYERRFGLITTLNSVPSNKIRSIDKSSFDPLHRQTKTQGNRTATPQEFGMDIEQDLLRAITGVPSDPSLGSLLSGFDALHANVDISLVALPAFLRRILKQYRSAAYKQVFPWIDNIAEVSDLALRDNLNAELLSSIQNRRWNEVQLVLPEVIDWTRIEGFVYGAKQKLLSHADLDIAQWSKGLDSSAPIDVGTLHRAVVRAVDSDWNEVYSWTTYKCLYAEVDVGGDHFILSAGAWYQLERDFVQTINRSVARIPKFQGPLPKCDKRTEKLYNEFVARDARYCLMDRRLIARGGGHSSIEFCDLFSSKKEIIHVKWYGGSAVLSHLFSQGLISGELFLSDTEFRHQLNQKLGAGFRLNNPAARPDSRSYTVAFAIIDCDRAITELPFFSRVNLRSVVQRLTGMGYSVAYVSISLDPLTKQISVVKPRKAKKTKKH